MIWSQRVHDVSETQKVARCLLSYLRQQSFECCWVSLSGSMGVGKTTFVRLFLRACGHLGVVPSPTYGLMEQYDALSVDNKPWQLLHFDCYRVLDVHQLDMLGVADYMGQHNTVCMVEWYEKCGNVFPMPDIVLHIESLNDAGDPDARKISCSVDLGTL